MRDLVERGWAVANVEYRRVGGGGGFPATFDDVRAAHDAVLEAPGIDPSRVACVGHSAGGHLALWLAAERPLRAVVAQAAIADLELAWTLGTGGTAIADLLGGTPDQVPDRYAAASPARRPVPSCPVLAVHGSADEVVPRAVATRFAERFGARVEVVDGEGHYAHLRPASRSWRVAADFLDAHR